jgi:hypothetical protein
VFGFEPTFLQSGIASHSGANHHSSASTPKVDVMVLLTPFHLLFQRGAWPAWWSRLPLVGLLLAACSGSSSTRVDPLGTDTEAGNVAVVVHTDPPDLAAATFAVTNATGLVVSQGILDSQEPGQFGVTLALPAGDDYSLQVRARAADASTCLSAIRFDLAAQQDLELELELPCRPSPLLVCPGVFHSAAPTTAAVGSSIALEATGPGVSEVTLGWSADSGRLNGADRASATLVCSEAGPLQVVLTISGPNCTERREIELQCGTAAR